MTPPASPTRDRAMILGAAVLFSTGGAAVKACALTGWQVASFRRNGGERFVGCQGRHEPWVHGLDDDLVV